MYLRQELFWAAVLIGLAASTQSASVKQLNHVYSSKSLLINHTLVAVETQMNDCKECNEKNTMLPLIKAGNKWYYLGVISKVNWFNAHQICRYHGMDLVSISSQQENDQLIQLIKDAGYEQDRFWTSGTDLAKKGKFVWMSNGRSLTFEYWHAGEPNNGSHENAEKQTEIEHCLELWYWNNQMRWNDMICSENQHFICEVRTI